MDSPHKNIYDDIISESATKESEEEYIAAIARRIESRRNELKYSYQDLASITGLSKSTLQRYVSGSIRNIPISKLKSLATALECSPDWLLGWSDEKKPVHRSKFFDSTTKIAETLEKSSLFTTVVPKHSVDYLQDDDTIQSTILMGKISHLLETSDSLNELLEIFTLLDEPGREAILSTARAILKLKKDDGSKHGDFKTGNTKYF